MRNTVLARNLIRESGLPFWNTLYTNKYKNCRTVKATVPSDVTERQLADAAAYVEASIDGASVKIRRFPRYYGNTGLSFIVRLPLES